MYNTAGARGKAWGYEEEGERERRCGGGGERWGEGEGEEREECSVTDASGHINFFTDLQKGVRMMHPTGFVPNV